MSEKIRRLDVENKLMVLEVLYQRLSPEEKKSFESLEDYEEGVWLRLSREIEPLPENTSLWPAPVAQPCDESLEELYSEDIFSNSNWWYNAKAANNILRNRVGGDQCLETLKEFFSNLQDLQTRVDRVEEEVKRTLREAYENAQPTTETYEEVIKRLREKYDADVIAGKVTQKVNEIVEPKILEGCGVENTTELTKAIIKRSDQWSDFVTYRDYIRE